MKKAFLTSLIFVTMVTSAVAQNLNEYKFVRVPAEFDFLKSENQYQLNALTAFLFEKYGFEAVYEEKLPLGVEACDILRADVHKDSGLLRTRLYFTLQDCNGNVVYTSATGVSIKKEFKVAYHEALRKAFTSFEELNYQYSGETKEIVVDPVVASEEVEKLKEVSTSEGTKEVVVDPVGTSEEIAELEKEAPVKENGFRSYTNGNYSYQLRKTSSGFELFRGDNEKFATLVKSRGGDNYIYSAQGVQGSAYFDENNNLVVEYLDSSSGQLITVNYNLQD